MNVKGFDPHARRIMAASLDWWNSCTLENMTNQTDGATMAKLERDLELGKELFLELTGHTWYQDCPYLEFVKEG